MMTYVLLILALLLGIGFVVLNWTAIMAPVQVDLMVVTVTAPLGMLMITWFGVLFLIVAYGMVAQLVKAFNTTSKLSKEIKEQRKLAANAEESRLNDVKESLNTRWKDFLEQEKLLLQGTEERMMSGQEKVMVTLREVMQQNAENDKGLVKDMGTVLESIDQKISKVLISTKALETGRSSSGV